MGHNRETKAHKPTRITALNHTRLRSLRCPLRFGGQSRRGRHFWREERRRAAQVLINSWYVSWQSPSPTHSLHYCIHPSTGRKRPPGRCPRSFPAEMRRATGAFYEENGARGVALRGGARNCLAARATAHRPCGQSTALDRGRRAAVMGPSTDGRFTARTAQSTALLFIPYTTRSKRATPSRSCPTVSGSAPASACLPATGRCPACESVFGSCPQSSRRPPFPRTR
jgi:hypothetical protein